MTDAIPMGWRTPFRRHDGHRSGLMLDTSGGLPDCDPRWRERSPACTPGARGPESTQTVPAATLRAFWQRERCGGPREACDASNQRLSATALGGTSRRQLALVVGCSKTAVSDYRTRAQLAGLTDWPAVSGLDVGPHTAAVVDHVIRSRRIRSRIIARRWGSCA